MNTPTHATASLGHRARRKALRVAKEVRRTSVRTLFRMPLLKSFDPAGRVVALRDCTRLVNAFAPSQPGDWRLKVFAAEKLQRAESRFVSAQQEEIFRRSTTHFQGGCECLLEDVHLASFHNASVYGADLLVLTSSGSVVSDSALNRSEVIESSGLTARVLSPKPSRCAEEMCQLSSPWSQGQYYHWMFDSLPRLAVIEQVKELANVPLLVSENLSRFHFESLKLARIEESRVHRAQGNCTKLRRLYYPDLLAPTGWVSPRAVAWLRARFLQQPNDASTEGASLLYVTRRDASQRRVLNEEELISYLQTQGFSVICPGQMNLTEQINVFRSAKVVVAPHGAGLTNMVFAAPGATLIELFGDNYVNGCFWALANICGHQHGCIIGHSTWLDYTIDLEQLKRLLDEMTSLPRRTHVQHCSACHS